MAHSEGLSDDAFLDEVFDAVSSEIAEGHPASSESWLRLRPHLAVEIEEAVRLAAEVSVVGSTAAPSLPGYEVVSELGRGGMGSVYLARQKAVGDRLVALKVLPQGVALSRQARARFRTEAMALARIRHDHVVAVHDVLDVDHTPAYAMEWVDGCSLLEAIELWGLSREVVGDRWSPRVVARYGAQVAEALTAAHRAGLLHRDVKPSNVMIRKDGVALLTDFGLARDEESLMATRTGAFLGTPAYAAPEQLRGDVVDERTDIYGLGATLYHALSGETPFGDCRRAEILSAVEHGRLRPLRRVRPGVPRDLGAIVEVAMDPDPERRYATPAEVLGDLERYLAGRPILARPPGLLRRLSKTVRRNRATFLTAVSSAVVVILLAVAVAVYLAREATVPKRFAEHVRKARLSILDPRLDERLGIVIRRQRTGAPPEADRRRMLVAMSTHDQALAHYDAALALREDANVRAVRDSVALARAVLLDGDIDIPSIRPPRLVREAAARMVAARASSLDRAPSATELAVADASRRERRCLGVFALLVGADRLCVAAWSGLDLAEHPDPLVDAALGQLYRQQGKPALAWPRLERAFEHFTEAMDLCAALAEVALDCGDPAYALRLLDRVDAMEGSLAHDVETRVRADTLWAVGRRGEARLLYSRHAARNNVPPRSHHSLAEWYAAEGRYREALHHRWRLAIRWGDHQFVFEGWSEVLDGFWDSMSPDARVREVRRSLDEPGTFLDQVAYVVERGEGVDGVLVDRGRVARLTPDRLLRWRRADAEQKVRFAEWIGGGTAPAPEPPLIATTPVGLVPMATTTTVVSRSSTGALADGDCHHPSISADGRYVAFLSTANNLGSSREKANVLVLDRSSGGLQRVWVGTPSLYGDREHVGPAATPRISGDGRFVAFHSRWAIPGGKENYGDWDLFLWERETGACRCLSVDSSGRALGLGTAVPPAPSISHDGSRVLGWLRDPAHEAADFLHRLTLLEVATGRELFAFQPTDRHWLLAHRLSSDGRIVAFESSQADLRMPDLNMHMTDVFVWEEGVTGIRCVSEHAGRHADFGARLVGMTRNGDDILLESLSTNLLPVANYGAGNLLRFGLRDGALTLLGPSSVAGSMDHQGAICGDQAAFSSREGVFAYRAGAYGREPLAENDRSSGRAPQWSADGRYLVFAAVVEDSDATQIVIVEAR